MLSDRSIATFFKSVIIRTSSLLDDFHDLPLRIRLALVVMHPLGSLFVISAVIYIL